MGAKSNKQGMPEPGVSDLHLLYQYFMWIRSQPL
jgi:hypothetical protein